VAEGKRPQAESDDTGGGQAQEQQAEQAKDPKRVAHDRGPGPFQNVTNFVEHGQLLFVLPYCSHLIRPVSIQNKNIGEHFVNQK
jgi:hypothetical protein